MSRPLTEYFKVVGTPQTMPNTTKRKLSLKRTSTPQKTKKASPAHAVSTYDLTCDDNEVSNFQGTLCKKEINNSLKDHVSIQNVSMCEEASNSSEATIIYTPETPRKSQTPQSSFSKSPGSRDKFFSPVKKKNLKLRSPSKVKKNLCSVLDANKDEDQPFQDACSWKDDKTMFLFTIINKYLTTDELRPLLLKQSQDLLIQCMNTKKPGLRLVCRLYWRKEGWYRLDKIKEISTDKNDSADDSVILDMINNLTKNFIIESSDCKGSKSDIGLKDRLMLLKLDELKSICKQLKIKATNKPEAIDCLISFSKLKTNISSYFVGHKTDNASRLLKMITEKTGPCFRLTKALRQTLSELYQLMYLGIYPDVIKEKKLELTLINDNIKRECYPDVDVRVDNASVVFKTRDDFERYLQAQNVYDEFLDTTDLTDKCQVVETVYSLYKNIDDTRMARALPLWLQKFTPPYLYVKILEAGLQELKKMKTERSIALALDISTQLIAQPTFRQHKKAEWYAEKALILDKFMSDGEGAGRVLLEGFGSELSDVLQDWLRPRAGKLAARRVRPVGAALRDRLLRHATKQEIMENNLDATHIYKNPMDVNKNRGKIKFETRTSDGGRLVQDAEPYCIQHYLAQGTYTHGEHWEGKIVTTIFFLLFWDIIYAKLADVPGLFLTHYQEFPLDLFLDSFYVNRKALIEGRLREIAAAPADAALARMAATWHSRPETELSGISRDLGWDKVSMVSQCLGPRALAAACRRLAHDYRYAHSGFPDLTLWNVHTKEIKFVEVKTDSDKPSMKQKQWMHYLRAHGIRAEFCYVGVNTTKCRARNSANCV